MKLKNYTEANFNKDLKNELKNIDVKQLITKNQIMLTHKDFEEFNENLDFPRIMNKQKKLDALIKEKLGTNGSWYEQVAYLLAGIILGFSSVVAILVFIQDAQPGNQARRSKHDTGGSSDSRLGESL